uniref:Uncharacterized protein n=1 Tax=Mandrillus leucophaeus TaxID=9568 RepID=A0A2K6ACK2_MANLE
MVLGYSWIIRTSASPRVSQALGGEASDPWPTCCPAQGLDLSSSEGTE